MPSLFLATFECPWDVPYLSEALFHRRCLISVRKPHDCCVWNQCTNGLQHLMSQIKKMRLEQFTYFSGHD